MPCHFDGIGLLMLFEQGGDVCDRSWRQDEIASFELNLRIVQRGRWLFHLSGRVCLLLVLDVVAGNARSYPNFGH